jgi:hypothetical protein
MKAFIGLLLVAVVTAQVTLDMDRDLVTTMMTTPTHKYLGPYSSHLYGNMPITDRIYADAFKHQMYNPLTHLLKNKVLDVDPLDMMKMKYPYLTTGRYMSLEDIVKTPLFMEYYNIPLFRQWYHVPVFKVWLMTPQFQMYWTNPMFKVMFENPTYFYKYIYPMVFHNNVNTWTNPMWTRGIDMVDIPEYRRPFITTGHVNPLFNLWNVFGRTENQYDIYHKFLLEKLLKTVKITKPEITEVKTDVKVEKPNVVRVDEQTYGKFVDPITHEIKIRPVGDVNTIEAEVAKKVIIPEDINIFKPDVDTLDLPLPLIKRMMLKPTFGARFVHPKLFPLLMKLRNEIPTSVFDELRITPKVFETSHLDLDTLYNIYHKLNKLEEFEEIRKILKNDILDMEIPNIEKMEILNKIRRNLYRIPLTYSHPVVTPMNVPVTFPRDEILTKVPVTINHLI